MLSQKHAVLNYLLVTSPQSCLFNLFIFFPCYFVKAFCSDFFRGVLKSLKITPTLVRHCCRLLSSVPLSVLSRTKKINKRNTCIPVQNIPASWCGDIIFPHLKRRRKIKRFSSVLNRCRPFLCVCVMVVVLGGCHVKSEGCIAYDLVYNAVWDAWEVDFHLQERRGLRAELWVGLGFFFFSWCCCTGLLSPRPRGGGGERGHSNE